MHVDLDRRGPRHAPDVLPHPAGARLRRDPRALLLRYARAVEPRDLTRVLAKAGLVLDPPERRGRRERGRTGGRADVWVRARSADVAAGDLGRLAEAVGARWAAPVYTGRVRGMDQRVVVLPDALVVRVVDAERTDEVRRYLEALGAEVDEKRSAAVWGRERRDAWYLRVDAAQRPAPAVRAELVSRLSPDCADALGFVPAERIGAEVFFEHLPVDVPVAFEPSDDAYASGDHWNLDRIRLTGPGTTAWDLQPGAKGVTAAVLDARPDSAQDTPFQAPIDLGDPANATLSAGDHGSQVVAVLAATADNALGVTGVAGGATVMPCAFSGWTDVELAVGIRAAADAGATVISISAGSDAWNPAVVDEAIVDAHAAGVFVCAAAQNFDREDGVTYPASNGLVAAVGASDEQDRRVAPPVHGWGSNYGHGLSLVAPGVAIPWAVDGQRTVTTEGTSAATPHVAGVAALVRAARPDLTGDDVRALLEETAVRGPDHADVAGYPTAPWEPQTGHGRLDALSAIERAPDFTSVDRGYHQTDAGPATLGPIFMIPADDCEALRLGERPAPVLDVQPSVAEAVRSLLEHAAGGVVASSHVGPDAQEIPKVHWSAYDLFDGAGRPLKAIEVADSIVLVRASSRPRQAEVMARVRACSAILETVVHAEHAAFLAALDPPPPEPLYPLYGDYASFEEFAWHVLLHNAPPPWAHSSSWFHNLRHLFG